MDEKAHVAHMLADAARLLAALKRDLLTTLKSARADLERDDFLWHYLLQSYSTRGGSSGWAGLIGNATNYNQLTYEALSSLPDSRRVDHAKHIFRRAGVRYANKKGSEIVKCFDRVNELGGLISAKRTLLQQSGRDAKIRFLKLFSGIGDKYSRNIMMDVYHEDFRDSIALDSRIKAISDKWQLTFGSYPEHESFYLSVATEAGLNGWELDRLMYRFQTVFFPPLSSHKAE